MQDGLSASTVSRCSRKWMPRQGLNANASSVVLVTIPTYTNAFLHYRSVLGTFTEQAGRKRKLIHLEAIVYQ